RQLLFEVSRVSVEEGQRDVARLVMGEDAIGNAAVAARRRLVPVDPKVQRDDLALLRAGDAGTAAPVDDGVWQNEQKIADARLAPAEVERQHALDEGGDFGTDAGQRG